MDLDGEVTMSSTRRTVVVGVDDSPTSLAALRWASTWAKEHRLPLQVVHAVHVWDYDALGGGADLDRGRRLVDAAVGDPAVVDPEVEVVPDVVAGDAAPVLVQRSADARVLVVGARGRGGFLGLRLGSVSDQVAAHAACPVVVVREHEGTGVVVGVDGSPTSEQAIAFAFEDASAHGGPLTAVYAWQPVYAELADVPYRPSVEGDDTEQAELLSERLAGWSEKHPDVEVRHVVQRDHPVAALLDRAATARLLVVGTHGRGGFRRMLLGSVSRGVLHHAPCTVAVVRDGAHAPHA